MVSNQPICSKCGGTLIKDEDGRKCLNCGHVWVSNRDLGKFYKDHRSEIEADLKAIGRTKTMGKWQIASGTLAGLLKKWGIKEAPAPRAPAVSPTPAALPRFPDYNESWPPEAQVAWLNIYQVLIEKQ